MNPKQIKFKNGVFLKFTSTRSFALGGFDVQVGNGEPVEFDGSTVKYAGNEYSFPNLRGAIKANWLVLDKDYDENDPNYGRPVSANIKVRHATEGGNPLDPKEKMTIATTESDEQIVGNAVEHAANTKAANAAAKAKQGSQGQRSASTEIEPQEGVPVRTLKTAAGEKAKQNRTVLTSETAGRAIREAENVQIDAGEGRTEDEMLAQMSEVEQDEYRARKESLKGRYVDEPPANRTVVGGVETEKHAESEGIKASMKVGGGVETADPIDPGEKAKETVRTEEGMTFRNTNVGKDKVQAHPRSETQERAEDGTEDARLKVAKAVCPDFPTTYDFAAPDRKKLARLTADFEDRPDVIRAVFAAESDKFKATLLTEFPAAFAG